MCSLSAQEALQSGEVEPMGHWVEFHNVQFKHAPILVHLRTGYERAVVLPEAVKLKSSDNTLPGSEIVVDQELVGFYPTQNFSQRSIHLVGLTTGSVYEFHVSASPAGMRQPIKVIR